MQIERNVISLQRSVSVFYKMLCTARSIMFLLLSTPRFEISSPPSNFTGLQVLIIQAAEFLKFVS